MFDQAGFSKMFDILKKKGYYSQFADYEAFKSQQAKDKEQIEKDARQFDSDRGNSVVPDKLPF